MPRGERRSGDTAHRAYAYLERGVNEILELTYLRVGAEPDWERVRTNGIDITDSPELWTRYQPDATLARVNEDLSLRLNGSYDRVQKALLCTQR